MRFSFPNQGRVPHISLVFREMWDATDLDRQAHRMDRKLEGKSSGIPYLAKNERDMGHPSLVREPGLALVGTSRAAEGNGIR